MLSETLDVEVKKTMRVLLLLYEPLKSIREQAGQFLIWWLVAIVVGLAGIWLPLLILHFSSGGVYITFQSILKAGSLASFCVVILAEGIASNLVARKTGSSETALGIRGVFSILAIILLLIVVSVMMTQHVGGEKQSVSVGFQVVLAMAAILMASYMYCFRFPAWGEKGVDAHREEENHEVQELEEKAEVQRFDEAGVRL